MPSALPDSSRFPLVRWLEFLRSCLENDLHTRKRHLKVGESPKLRRDTFSAGLTLIPLCKGDGQATEKHSQGCDRSSRTGKPSYSGGQGHQGHFQPDRREGMPPFRSDDVEGARRVYGEDPKRGCARTIRKELGVRSD